MTSTTSDRLISSDLFVEGPTPARFWGDQWLRVSEKLLKGLNHQFTNRVASLDATVSLFELDGPPDGGFARVLTGEIARLHELLRLYRSLTSEPITAPEPARLQDILPMAIRLQEHHSDLRQIPYTLAGDPDAEPVLVRHSGLLRSVLVLLASVAGNVLRSGREGAAVEVEFGSSAGETWLRLRGAAPSGQLLFSGEGSLLHAVRAALSHAHASADGVIRRSNEGDELEYELRFPTLAMARQAHE